MAKYLVAIRMELEITVAGTDSCAELERHIHAQAQCTLISADVREVGYNINVGRIPEKLDGV